MGFWNRDKPEERATATQSTENFFQVLGLDQGGGIAGQTVTARSALGVPAVFAAVNFIAGTVAGLPLQVFQRTTEGKVRVSGDLASLLHSAVNDETTSFDWRKYTFDRVLTGGRGLTQIRRRPNGEIVDLFPLDPTKVTIKRVDGKRRYEYKEGGGKITFGAKDVLDLPFMLAEDRVSHIGPIASNKTTIALAQAVTEYGARFFSNGGVPPFVVTGGFKSGKALNRASDDLTEAVKRATKEDRQALVLPDGLDIKSLGIDPAKTQMVETQRFLIEQIARIYSLPPTFLQDLTNGTYSNTEQQDLHFVKHTLKKWIEQFEQEMNLKFFGRGSDMFVEFEMDGLLRGDFKTRMEGYAQGIQNGVMKPNEARSLENRPKDPAGDSLMIQGATVPIENQLKESTNED